MIKLKKERKGEPEDVSAASMSDVAFLLLVFFMVASVFFVKEGVMSKLPRKNSQPRLVLRENVYKFMVNKSSIDVENSGTGKQSYKTFEEFKAGLPQLQVDNIGSKYALLLSSKGSNVQNMVSVLAAVKKRGFNRISLQRYK